MPDEKCRLAKLEERADYHDDQFAEIRMDVKDIKFMLENQKGFVRGIAFAITAIVSGIGLVINYWNK
jgi:hypothetical protein